MTQPWDYWHEDGASGLTVYNVRDQQESAGVVGGGGGFAAPHMLTARPFWVGDEGLRVTSVSLSTESNQSGACRFGIYACPPPSAHDMYPSTLVSDIGELVLAGALARPVKTLAAPLDLAPGFYYLATLFRVATPAERLAGFTGLTSVSSQPLLGGPGFPLGYSPSSASNAPLTGFSTYFPYGSLPATFPALAAGSFGVLYSNFNNAPFNIDYAIYVESAGTGAMGVTIQYNAAVPLGTAVKITDTPSSVVVQYNGNLGTPCPQASVLAALLSTIGPLFDPSNIVNAQSVGSAINFNSTAFGTNPAVIQLQRAGPLQGYATLAAMFLPVTAISVVASP
jgi:hypothetical protein